MFAEKISKRSKGGAIRKENHIMCMMILAFQWIYGQDPPAEFAFNQSTVQAFYLFNTVRINGVVIESDDWVAAFNGDVCVGARQWDVSNCGGGVCDVPTMGYDGSSYTEGYMQDGDIPSFKIYNSTSNAIFNATSSGNIDSWSNMNLGISDILDVMWSVNEADYQYNGSITASVNFNNLVQMNDMIAVLVDYEIRGIGVPVDSPLTNEWVFPMMVHSNVTSGEFIKFVYYISSSEGFISFDESNEFTSDMIIGNAEDPFILTSTYCWSDIDGCGNCVGENTGEGACSQDCNGEDGGTAWIDSCSQCVAEGDSSCIQGCDGNWSNDGSQLLNDGCDVCNGDGLSCLDSDISTISNFSMTNIYPNPFNPVVNIEFSCDKATYLDLSIYSLQGDKIGNLFDGFIAQGISSFIWEPQHEASGLYLITAILNGSIETKKVLFQK